MQLISINTFQKFDRIIIKKIHETNIWNKCDWLNILAIDPKYDNWPQNYDNCPKNNYKWPESNDNWPENIMQHKLTIDPTVMQKNYKF